MTFPLSAVRSNARDDHGRHLVDRGLSCADLRRGDHGVELAGALGDLVHEDVGVLVGGEGGGVAGVDVQALGQVEQERRPLIGRHPVHVAGTGTGTR